MLHIRPSSLSFTTNNVDSGMGGFTAFKWNEIINDIYEVADKSTCFRQVCQLLTSLIVGHL